MDYPENWNALKQIIRTAAENAVDRNAGNEALCYEILDQMAQLEKPQPDYTHKDMDMFHKMFIVRTEREGYIELDLTPYGFVNGFLEPKTYEESGSVEITLSNGNIYRFEFGECDQAEREGMKAFDRFKELKYNENAFEQYLKETKKRLSAH